MAGRSIWGRLRSGLRRGRTGRRGRDTVVIDDSVLQATITHLEDFTRSRRGVEAWIEAPTNLTRPSVLLIAHDGESTRRTVPSTRWGHTFAAKLQLPAYDAGVVPYPQRMRDWNRRRRS